MQLRTRVKSELKEAMRARDRATVIALRGILSALDNAEAVVVDAPAWPPVVNRSADVPRRTLTGADVARILQDEADEHQRALVQYEALGQPEVVEELRVKLAVVNRYLRGLEDVEGEE